MEELRWRQYEVGVSKELTATLPGATRSVGQLSSRRPVEGRDLLPLHAAEARLERGCGDASEARLPGGRRH